jgi:hypothetical protein
MGKTGNVTNPNAKAMVVKKPGGKVGGQNKKAVVSPTKKK